MRQEEVSRLRAGEQPVETYRQHVIAWVKGGLGGVKDGAAKRYRVSLRALDPHFATRKLHEITRRDIGRFVEARQADGVSNATIRRDLTTLSRLLSDAVAKGKLDHNPARDWDRSTVKERRDPIRRIDPRSLDACIAVAPFPLNHLIRFLLLNGSRLEETADLRVEDVRNGQVALYKTKATTPRVLTLSQAAAAELAAIRRPNYPTPYVFWNPDEGTLPRNGAPPRPARLSNLSRRFVDVRQAAAKIAKEQGWTFRPFRLHDLRHEFAIRWLEEGGSIYELQGHLGHTSVKTTEIYLAHVPAHIQARAKGKPYTKPDA